MVENTYANSIARIHVGHTASRVSVATLQERASSLIETRVIGFNTIRFVSKLHKEEK